MFSDRRAAAAVWRRRGVLAPPSALFSGACANGVTSTATEFAYYCRTLMCVILYECAHGAVHAPLQPPEAVMRAHLRVLYLHSVAHLHAPLLLHIASAVHTSRLAWCRCSWRRRHHAGVRMRCSVYTPVFALMYVCAHCCHERFVRQRRRSEALTQLEAAAQARAQR
jgi:hypothetical protein